MMNISQLEFSNLIVIDWEVEPLRNRRVWDLPLKAHSNRYFVQKWWHSIQKLKFLKNIEIFNSGSKNGLWAGIRLKVIFGVQQNFRPVFWCIFMHTIRWIKKLTQKIQEKRNIQFRLISTKTPIFFRAQLFY